jgi:hypothetical protein
MLKKVTLSYYLDYEFDKLNRLIQVFFILLVDFFLQFHHYTGCKLGFVICFSLFFMRLFLSYDLGHEFDMLNKIDSSFFMFFF